MDNHIEHQIVEAEEKLRLAMLHSDVKALDELLSPRLLFTNHLGHLVGKEEDLAGHKSGALKLNSLSASEQQILLTGDVAIVSVKMQLSGSYNDTPTNGIFRFTRVWSQSQDGTWQIIAGHSGIVS
ncbi:nuclear transport factor 2 family protein [Scytonema millei]|uniref:Nuclear transport factor 2 family protein n=1 Tax=Scytonema millei VB511283 TaxID=1245923 RepID=A0A9X5I553_9CYAN|nr:nuclear transport factor 2 family protein [Scytonema millei]NHC35339.1 nuclear transport factor 2 family protein [Scytonema millei VB511283]